MPSGNGWRVIEGGRGASAPPESPPALPIDQLRERALQLRVLLALSPHVDAAGMANDMDEAIDVLGRLELTGQQPLPERAAEYRALIAEIEAEIISLLRGN